MKTSNDQLLHRKSYMNPYRRVFSSAPVRRVLMAGKIATHDESANAMLHKIADRVTRAELALGEKLNQRAPLTAELRAFMQAGQCQMGSPLLTNIFNEHPTLASCCSVPPDQGIGHYSATMAEQYYRLNMGSGYNLDSYADPAAALVTLNGHAERVECSNVCERYIGNMAHISYDHPRAAEFAAAKVAHKGLRHFNISIDVTEGFMESVRKRTRFLRRDGTFGNALELWCAIIDSAWRCGDPGIISLERFNQLSATGNTTPYITTAPCAEVGLSVGETCVFGYINLAACLGLDGGRIRPCYPLISRVATCLTRVLDNCIEDSLDGYPSTASAGVMAGNRKIGIGLCGFADALVLMGIDYGSDESCEILREVMSIINLSSKHASVDLAIERGSFLNYNTSRYVTDSGFTSRFKDHAPAHHRRHWEQLDERVQRFGIRNCMTVALPPSGRTALLMGVQPSIEPTLRLKEEIEPSIAEQHLIDSGLVAGGGSESFRMIGQSRRPQWPQAARSVGSLFRESREISHEEHLKVLQIAARLVDDGASKTFNLPSSATLGEVSAIYTKSWDLGLKAVSVYRDKSIS